MNNTTTIPNPTMVTTDSNVPEYYLSSLWISYQIPAALLLAIATYLMVAVIGSVIRKHKSIASMSSDSLPNEQNTEGTATGTVNGIQMNEVQNSRTTRSQNRDANDYHSKSPVQKRKYCMNILNENLNDILLITAVVFTFLYSIVPNIDLAYGWRSEAACFLTFQFTIVFYACGIVAVYITLWFRQHKLYTTRAIRHLANSFLRTVSFSMLSVTIISFIVSVIVLNLSASPFSDPSIGCLRENTNFPRWVRIAILPVLGIVQQALLLGLVIYPLNKHVHTPNGTASGMHEQNIRSLIKRLAGCTIACVVSDIILVILLVVFGGSESSGILGQLLTTANLIVNVLSLTFSFVAWRDKLFIFGSCRKVRSEIAA